MSMSLAEFEVKPTRSLSKAQEQRLDRKYLCGDISGGPWSTVASLIKLGYLTADCQLTEKGAHYCYHLHN